MKRIAVLAALAWLAAPVAARSDPAEGLPLEAGLWRVEQTTTTPAASTPQVRVSEACVEGRFTPDDLVVDDDGGCVFSDVRVSGRTLYWTIRCPRSGAAGTGEFTSAGTTAFGHMSMRLDLPDRDMSFSTRWEAQRLGDC